MRKTRIFNSIKRLFFLIPFLFACNKEQNELGLELLSHDKLLSIYTDSSTICSLSTEYDTEIRSSRFSYMLGNYVDPITGTHSAAFASRFYLDSLSVDIQGYTLDSMSFVMFDTSYFYGNSKVPQTISIAELHEDLTVDVYTNYYNNAIIPEAITNNTTLIGEKQYTPQFNAENGFRYTFPQTYANNLFARIKNIYSLDTTKQHIDSLLVQEFKGLYVFSETSDAAIIRYVSPQIYMYISSGATTKTIALLPSPTSFQIEDESDPSHIYIQSLSFFNHNFSTDIVNAIGSTPQDVYYVQGNAGLKTNITFPNLDLFRDSIVAINSAMLYIPIENQDFQDFPYPPLLNLRIYDSNRDLAFATLSVHFDSVRYTFNCQHFLTSFLNDVAPADAYQFEITVPDNNVFANRVVLKGTKPEEIKLVITYTK